MADRNELEQQEEIALQALRQVTHMRLAASEIVDTLHRLGKRLEAQVQYLRAARTVGGVVAVEPPDGALDAFNRADPHCETCGGRGTVDTGEDTLVCPCVDGPPEARKEDQRQ